MPATRDRSSPSAFRVCALYHRAVELIGRRWNGAIIEALMGGARRFCEIRAAVPGLKDPQLARRLRELEREGIVERRVVPTQPVRVEYALTPKGEDLRAVLAAVHRWAQRWLGGAHAGDPASAAEPAALTTAGRPGLGPVPSGRRAGAPSVDPGGARRPGRRPRTG